MHLHMKSVAIISGYYTIIIFHFLLVLASTFSKCTNTLHSFPFSIAKNYTGVTINQCPKMKSISDWSFTHPSLLTCFQIDPIKENYVRKVPGAVFSRVQPTPLKTQLQLVSASDGVLENIMDLEPAEKTNIDFANFIAGNKLLPGSETIAHRYGGYQFGYWADQLGDGRAIALGEYVNRYCHFQNSLFILMFPLNSL